MHAYIASSQNYCVQPADILQLTSETTSPEVQPAKMQDASALFTIFPNPTNGIFTLGMNDVQSIQVEIFGMMGEKVLQHELSGSQQYQFDLTDWPNGVYLIRVVAGGKLSVGKLIKQ